MTEALRHGGAERGLRHVVLYPIPLGHDLGTERGVGVHDHKIRRDQIGGCGCREDRWQPMLPIVSSNLYDSGCRDLPPRYAEDLAGRPS